ncbi:hypothetical protein C8R45DRAFT_144950 [Mycena sanguinolenta]|nr:hypothetical protein C8R45DRAFT_144950 [Mycena sanguinolenta]
MDEFRQYMNDIMVIRVADHFGKADSILQISTMTQILRKIKQMLFCFRRLQRGYMGLADDASLVALTGSPSFAFNFNPELKENIIHWYHMSSNSHTSKPLWVTTHNNEWCIGLSRIVTEFLSSNDDDSRPGVTVIDVSQTHTVFWPLIRGLMSASPEYTREIGTNPPYPFDYYLGNWNRDYSSPGEDVGKNIILRIAHKCLTDKILASGSTDAENVVAGAPPILVIHGIRTTVQSNELYETFRWLESGIRLVIISRPEFLRHVSNTDPKIMQHVCTMHLPDTGPIIYSGRNSSPPLLNENVFLLLLDGIHRSGGSEAERVVWQTSKFPLEWNGATEMMARATPQVRYSFSCMKRSGCGNGSLSYCPVPKS